MDKKFVAIDKLNSVAIECIPLVRFKFNNSDYLIYYSPDDDVKCKMFISELVFDNGVYKIIDIKDEEKEIFNDLGYKIVAGLPSLYKNGVDFYALFSDFSLTNNINFDKDIPALGEQNLCKHSFLAVSNLEDIVKVKLFYDTFLSRFSAYQVNNNVWSIPNMIDPNVQNIGIQTLNSITPVAVSDNVDNNNNVGEAAIEVNSIIPISTSGDVLDNSKEDINVIVQPTPVVMNPVTTVSNEETNSLNLINKVETPDNFNANNVNLNQEVYKAMMPLEVNALNITSNVDLNTEKQDTNLEQQQKNAGYAGSKYIVIGTVCLVLAAFIVAISIMFVKTL